MWHLWSCFNFEVNQMHAHGLLKIDTCVAAAVNIPSFLHTGSEIRMFSVEVRTNSIFQRAHSISNLDGLKWNSEDLKKILHT